MSSHVRLVLAAVCATVVVLMAGVGVAAKPGSGGPVPSGTLYFRTQFDVLAMRGDGSQLHSEASIDNNGYQIAPSLDRYGSDGHRWFLFLADGTDQEQDLYATVDGSEWILLVDGGLSVHQIETGESIRARLRMLGDVSWSNDGLDRFISIPIFYAEDLLTFDEFGNEQWERILTVRGIVQWEVSAADLEQSNPEPLTSIYDGRLTWCVTTDAPYFFDYHAWSPEGDQLVYVLDSIGEFADELRVADVTSGPVDADAGLLIFTSQGLAAPDQPGWSRHINPADQRISFAYGGSLRTIRPDGSGMQTLVSSGLASVVYPAWSPDNAYLAYRRRTQKGFKVTYTLERVPSGGGSPVVLLSQSESAGGFSVLGWCDE
jgi:hypothetical protein